MVKGLEQYAIYFKELKNGSASFSFLLDDQFFGLFEDSEVKGGEVKAEVEVRKSSASIYLSTTIEGEVMVECDRCLDHITIEVNGTSQSEAAPDGSTEENEGIEIDAVEEKMLLGEYLYQSVLLSLPYSRTHLSLEECNPKMLEHFKIVSQEEFDALTSPQESIADNPESDKLAALKQKLEKQE